MQRAIRQSVPSFTLIELLVVISIISLLMAITLPALNNAREQARATQCLSNLRQVGLAVEIYRGDFKDYLPVERDASESVPDVYRYAPQATGAWHSKLARYMPYQRVSDVTRVEIQPEVETVIHCPSFDLSGAYTYQYPFYTHSNYINISSSFDPQTHIRGSSVVSPTEKAFVIDIGPSSTGGITTWFNLDNRFITSPMDDRFRYDHNGGASHLFFDGHAEVRGLNKIEEQGRWPWRTQFSNR